MEDHDSSHDKLPANPEPVWVSLPYQDAHMWEYKKDNSEQQL